MAQVRESRQELRRFMREARRGNPACVVSMQHDTLYCTMLYYTVLYCTMLYCTVLHCTVL